MTKMIDESRVIWETRMENLCLRPGDMVVLEPKWEGQILLTAKIPFYETLTGTFLFRFFTLSEEEVRVAVTLPDGQVQNYKPKPHKKPKALWVKDFPAALHVTFTEAREGWNKKIRIVSNGRNFRVERKGWIFWHIIQHYFGRVIGPVDAEFDTEQEALGFVDGLYEWETFKAVPFEKVWP